MSTVARNTRRYSRGKQTAPSGDVLSQVFDRFGHLLVTRDHGKGAPSYLEGQADPVYKFSVDTSDTLPAAPNTTAPTSGKFDLSAFGGACLYWRGTEASALVNGGTAQSAGADTIVLDPAASEDDNAYNGLWIEITEGTGAGQRALISDYDGASQEATVAAAWDTEPDATSVYEIRASFPATHTDIDLKVWALADTGDWVAVGTYDAVKPYTEIVIDGLGYRDVFFQVTDTAGGLVGLLDLLVAGC